MIGDERDLAGAFRRLIRRAGPISLAQYMGESNARYYSRADPLGIAGDFVTAPEISQMFGELIGLWLSDMWIRAGRTEPVLYVELGPGRGTLAKDALRSMKRNGLEPEVHFVEASAALKEVQLAVVPDARWHMDLSSVPQNGPLLLVANEFLDALPIRQLVRTGEGWRERMIGLDGEAFVFVAGGQPMDAAVPSEWKDEPEGTLIETCPAAAAVLYEVSGRLASQQGAALFIDYGHADARTGSTLQAVARHRKVDPLAAPGEADLTAHVDFDTLARIGQSCGAKWLGTKAQGEWLRALGIDMRAEILATRAPQRREELEFARDRLVDDDQMGRLFKVLGLAGPDWPDGVGFKEDCS